MATSLIQAAIRRVPAGPWAVGVSGGADSVALLMLLKEREDLGLCVVHLDHQIRGQASADDAAFVSDLAAKWNFPSVIARRDQIQPRLVAPPSNSSALYRALRHELFTEVVREKKLLGVLLAHHADDQAETVLLRLLRNAPPAGLAGMAEFTVLGNLQIVRPLLTVRRDELRNTLINVGQPHREDASNESNDYFRNRLRRLLVDHQMLVEPLLELSRSCAALRDWARDTAPPLPSVFGARQLARLPDVLARESARRWLGAGSPAHDLSGKVIDRLLSMAVDAAGPSRQHFPGGVIVRRRRGTIERS